MKVALKEELRMSARMGTAARMTRVNRGWGPGAERRSQSLQPPSQPAPTHTGAYGVGWGVSALWYLRQDREERQSTESQVKGEPKEGVVRA